MSASEPCEDDPAFVDSYGESCSYWTGYCTPGMETQSFFTYINDGAELSVAGNLAGDVQSNPPSSGAEIGGFNDGFGTYYSKDFWDGLREGCPASCLQCEEHWWHDGNTPAFDGAELLPGYGWCRTEDDYATTANRDDCTQSRIDAGQCWIPQNNTMKPASKDFCVDAATGVTDCYMACMADETCGCFSVTLDDAGAYAMELGCFSLSGGVADGICQLYPRANYDGTEVMWAKGSWGDIFYGNVGRRAYKMSPRAVTCKDCRTPPVLRRKLLFGAFHDDHDDDHDGHDMLDMPCCPE